MNNNKKSSLQEALIEAKEIEKAAFESAKKALQESFSLKIEEAVKESLKEIEESELNEGVKLEVDNNADLTIKVSADGTTIETGEESENFNSETEDNLNNNLDTNMENQEEIYEVEGLNEADAQPTDVNAPVANPAPNAQQPQATEEAPAVEENPEGEVGTNDLADEIKQINQKLDMILAHEQNEEAGEESSEQPSTEGEVEIVDDEEPQTEQPEQTEQPAQEEEQLSEYVNEMDEDYEEGMEEVVYEVEEGAHDLFEELKDLEEIEIVDEDNEEEAYEEEAMEEDTLAFRHSASQRNKIGNTPLGQHAPRIKTESLNENKIKAHYESKVDELKQENESLKETLKEYKESFIVLRKQINEVQIFNAKLAYANKLFTNGGLTNNEKIKIAEEFDKVETIEEAKKLYNKLISEVNISGKTAAEKIKSVKPAAIINNQVSQTLYESDEMRRMKKLAGIIKENQE